MSSAFTFYKFKELFILVVGIMFLLAILSVISPAKQEAKDQIVNELSKQDQLGVLNDSYQLSNEVNDLDFKSNTEEEAGNYFMKLLNEDFESFLLLAFLIAGVLFVLGVRLKSVRRYSRGLQKSFGGW